MQLHLQKACPILAARDIGAALAWYRDRLGFTIEGDWGDYGIASRDMIELHFWKCDDRHIAENTSAYIRVSNAQDAYETMKGAGQGGGRIVAPQRRAWGMVEFYVWDPDGNLLRFGEIAQGGETAYA